MGTVDEEMTGFNKNLDAWGSERMAEKEGKNQWKVRVQVLSIHFFNFVSNAISAILFLWWIISNGGKAAPWMPYSQS